MGDCSEGQVRLEWKAQKKVLYVLLVEAHLTPMLTDGLAGYRKSTVLRHVYHLLWERGLDHEWMQKVSAEFLCSHFSPALAFS